MRTTHLLLVSVSAWLALAPLGAHGEFQAWQKLDDGLYLGEFLPTKKSPSPTCPVIVLKISPAFYELKLLCASEHGGRPRTAQQWCDEFGLVAAINASMYEAADQLRSTGYMRNFSHINNPHISKVFGAIMVFNPIEPSLPPAQIIDIRARRNWENLNKKYNSVIQNYRMLSRGEKKGWPEMAQVHSAAAIGIDLEDNILFILSRAAYSVHDLILILLELPIRIRDAMYVEGGWEASLYYKLNNKGMITHSNSDPGRSQKRREDWAELPNMVGIAKRE